MSRRELAADVLDEQQRRDETLPCPTCSTDTELHDFCTHSGDALCFRCCGLNMHIVWGGCIT